MESKQYSWEWVTASRMLTDRECELVYAWVLPSGNAADGALYSGSNTTGTKIVQFGIDPPPWDAFSPPVPVYCAHGIYAAITAAITGIFVMWRNL